MTGRGYSYAAPDVPRVQNGLQLVEERPYFDREYRKPGLNLSRFDAVFPVPLELVYTDDFEREHHFDQAKGPDRMVPKARLDAYRQADLERLRGLFREALEREFGDGGAYRLVDEPGPGVLILGTGIIDLDLRQAHLEFAMDAGSAYSQPPVVIVGSTIQDGETGARLVELLDGRGGSATLEKGGLFWSQVSEAFGDWARRFRVMLDDARASQTLAE